MDKTLSRDGTTIAFDRSGSGPAVVLVGGALNDRMSTAPLASLLDARFTVLSYDRRGRGGSGDTAPYSVDREIEDLDAILGEAGGSAFVFGMSSGAALSLEAAARGLPITALALYEPPFVVGDGAGRPDTEFARVIAELTGTGRRGEAVELFLTRAVELPVDLMPRMRQSPMWAGLEELAHTLVYDITVMGDSRLPVERIGTVTQPALVLNGGSSPAWARESVRAVAQALPHGQQRTLNGQTHNVAPRALVPVLTEFFGG